MDLILKYPTCKKCGSHIYNSLSYGESDRYSMNCICGTLTKGVFTSKEVLPPLITFPNEEPKRYEKEREELYEDYEFGVNAKIIFDENSSYDSHCRNNCTEVHYLYGFFLREQRIAFESNLHGTGGTLPVEHIKEIIITIADKLEKSY